MDLSRVELIVLSACQTASGRLVEGEGIAGLAGACLLAGAGAVIGTQWRVYDRDTTRLMDALYEAMAAGAAPSEALRRAQLTIVRQRRDAPWVWAPFLLIGGAD